MELSNKLKKIALISASTLMFLSAGAGISNVNANASSKSVNKVGVIVFPSKATHHEFAYQWRKAGHNGRIHYASQYSKLGKQLFGLYGRKDRKDYKHYMESHHPRTYRKIMRKLEHIAVTKRIRNDAKGTKNVAPESSLISKHNGVYVINAKYNNPHKKALIKQLSRKYHHLVIRKDIGRVAGHKTLFGYFIGLHNNKQTRNLIWHLHRYNNAEQNKNDKLVKKPYNHKDISWYKHHAKYLGMRGNIVKYTRNHHHNSSMVYEYLYDLM